MHDVSQLKTQPRTKVTITKYHYIGKRLTKTKLNSKNLPWSQQ